MDFVRYLWMQSNPQRQTDQKDKDKNQTNLKLKAKENRTIDFQQLIIKYKILQKQKEEIESQKTNNGLKIAMKDFELPTNLFKLINYDSKSFENLSENE